MPLVSEYYQEYSIIELLNIGLRKCLIKFKIPKNFNSQNLKLFLMEKREFRANVLKAYGADASDTEELLAYNENVFNTASLALPVNFPLAPELHVATWENYLAEATAMGTFEALKKRLVQLQFPIREGISQTETYRAATRKGVPVDGMTEAAGLVLTQPEKLQLIVHQSPAGAIPVLIAANREDFVLLVQALTMRNEPKPVPASMGACMVAGFNNWDRISQYRQQWEANHSDNKSEAKWADEFKRLISKKELYQDRFIILSQGPYSNVSTQELRLPEAEWLRLSLTIRLEHECTHYFTRRLFNSMRNNLIDELIADYRGIVAATGRYRADWFLRFMGLESFPHYREGGRLQNYRGTLSEGSFKILQYLVVSAARNLESFERQQTSIINYTMMLTTLCCLTLEELASDEADSYLYHALKF